MIDFQKNLLKMEKYLFTLLGEVYDHNLDIDKVNRDLMKYISEIKKLGTISCAIDHNMIKDDKSARIVIEVSESAYRQYKNALMRYEQSVKEMEKYNYGDD